MDGWLEDMYTHIELQWSYNNNHETQLSYKLGSTGARSRKERMEEEGMNVRGVVRKWGHFEYFFKLIFNFFLLNFLIVRKYFSKSYDITATRYLKRATT